MTLEKKLKSTCEVSKNTNLLTLNFGNFLFLRGGWSNRVTSAINPNTINIRAAQLQLPK